jgi:hypothetical protein
VTVPGPPPGPGVAPPFVAPPADRNRRGLWIGLGVGGVLLLLCCVGGVFGIGVLIVGTIDEAKRQATAVVEEYLNATIDRDFDRARDQFCPDLAAGLDPADLAAEASRQPFDSYRLEEPRLAGSIEVTAHLAVGAGIVVKTFLVDPVGQEYKICGIN